MSGGPEEIDFFLMERLEEYFGDMWDPWGVEFDRINLEDDTIEPITESYSEAGHPDDWPLEKHAGRIRFLMTSVKDLETPIVLDSRCDHGYVYANPVMIDGWHRYFAHRALGSKKIPVAFSGLVKFADYLRGDTDERPD
jgi:hypothetical protein